MLNHNRRAAYFRMLADALTFLLAIVALLAAVVTYNPQPPGHYRDRIQAGNSSLVYVTVEVHTCPSHSERSQAT